MSNSIAKQDAGALVELMLVEGYCPFLTCHRPSPHFHPICPECGAVRFGNMFCGTCKDNRKFYLEVAER